MSGSTRSRGQASECLLCDHPPEAAGAFFLLSPSLPGPESSRPALGASAAVAHPLLLLEPPSWSGRACLQE